MTGEQVRERKDTVPDKRGNTVLCLPYLLRGYTYVRCVVVDFLLERGERGTYLCVHSYLVTRANSYTLAKHKRQASVSGYCRVLRVARRY